MLLEFFVKLVDSEGKYIRTMNVFACDMEMAMCMASNFLEDGEFVGGF